MKRHNKSLTIILYLIFSFFFTHVFATQRKTNFNNNWKFNRGETANGESPLLKDNNWRVLDVPHDWSVEPCPVQREGVTVGPFSKMSEGDIDTGQTIGGEGWYRKEFTVLPEDSDKLFTLYFEGVYNQSEVWVNGKKAYFNPYGYSSYKVDITDFLNPAGEPNIIAVKAVNAGRNSRWYAGSGIFRPVWIYKTAKTHLEEWDTYINASKLNGDNAEIEFSTIIYNREKKTFKGDLSVKIVSPDGKEVYSFSRPVKTGEKALDIKESFSIKNPALWSLETPQMYKAIVSIDSRKEVIDEIIIPFGIRTIEFNADKGFLLNGKPTLLKGGCVHHDNGLLGAASINRAEERKIELLKANGFNAIRCSHNLPAEYFLEMCDRHGMLVIDESFDQWQRSKRENDYHIYFDEYSDSDAATMVRRDRNHPSVIMWSIGNEIADRADPAGQQIAVRLGNTIRQFDNSRPVTAGVNDFWDNRHLSWKKDSHLAFKDLGVGGYNYMYREYENDHQAYPERVMYGSESVPKEASENWNLVEKHPYIIGDFVWTAIDYLGEAGLAHSLELAPGEHSPQFMGWPWYNAWCGDIDFCGDKKPQSYYRDIVWKEKDITMAVQAPVAEGKREDVNYWGWRNEFQKWNWPGLEGTDMTVRVYSRSPKVRLYLNDQIVGEAETNKDNYTATFTVPYTPGTLKAANIINGETGAVTELKTTGEPHAIRLSADRTNIADSKNDLSYVKIEIIDKEGNVIPDATIPLSITATGNGKVIAAGNAAYDDMKSFRSLNPNTFRGRAIAIVQPNEEGGDITVSVSSENIIGNLITIHTH